MLHSDSPLIKYSNNNISNEYASKKTEAMFYHKILIFNLKLSLFTYVE